jgi:hypothetical protein
MWMDQNLKRIWMANLRKYEHVKHENCPLYLYWKSNHCSIKIYNKLCKIFNTNMTSFFLLSLCQQRAIYRLGMISLAHATGACDWLSHRKCTCWWIRIRQHKLCATLSTNVNINYRLPIKVYYSICTLRHIRIEIIHGSQNVFWVLTWVGGYYS